jgi:hypothetical protein
LAHEAVENILRNDYTKPVRPSHIDSAAENLMRRGDAHIDSLMVTLAEPRVQSVVESMLSFLKFPDLMLSSENFKSYYKNVHYCIDIGLVKRDEYLRPANRLCAGVIIRRLNEGVRQLFPEDAAGKWMDGKKIDMNGLLKEFKKFWTQNSERYLKAVDYINAAPLLIFSAFL